MKRLMWRHVPAFGRRYRRCSRLLGMLLATLTMQPWLAPCAHAQTTIAAGETESGQPISGIEIVLGQTNNDVLDPGGQQIVSAGGNASGTIVSDGGQQIVVSNGEAGGTEVLFGGTLTVSAGGEAIGVEQEAGAALITNTSATLIGQRAGVPFSILDGAAQNVFAEAGGQLTILPGTSAFNTQVGSGGLEWVSSGGLASGTIVTSGGSEFVSFGGTAVGTSVTSNGSQTVLGTASGTTVFAGGSVFVSSGGTTSGTEVDSGGNEVVSSGGIARGTQVTSGGTQSVAGGTTSNTHVSAGGQQIVSSGGHTSGTLIDGGGTQTVSAGGTASASQISAGGTQVVSSGGIANSTSVGSGGTSIVTSGGTASATVVSGGGTQTVNAGGITSGTIVASGGMQTVGSGGTTSSTMVASGGTQDVQSGGSASGSIIASGGTQTISNGASVTGTQVLSGGTQNLFGTVVDPIISAGGTLTIGSGTAAGSIVGNTINDGLLAFDRPDTITYAGNISGAGRIEQQGTGSVVLNGDSHLFTGTSEVMAGTLAIGDGDNPGAQLGGNVIVDAAGTLRGHGSIIGNVTNNGNVMPGGSVGTLTVGGNYTQASNASLTIEVSPTTGSQLHVGGTAALSGNLQILYDPGSYQATRYAIVTASGGVNGKFASVSNTVQSGAQLGALQQSIEYSANEVDLALSGIAQQAPGGGAPATTVIAPVDTSIYTALGTSLTLSAQMTNAALLERIARVGATSGSNMSGNDTSADAASNDATPNNGRSGTDASSRASDRSGSDASSRASVWVNATGSQTKVHSTNDEPGFEARNYGFIAGADHQVGAYTVGFSGSYNHSDISEDSTGDSGTTDALRAAVYGARMLGPVQFSAVAGAGVDFLSQKRPFGTTGTAGASTAEGDHIGQEVSTAAQAALPLAAGSVLITPRIGLRFSYLHVNGFSESGANGQDLTVGTDNVRSLQPYAQITFDKAFGNALRPVDIEWRIGYARETLGTGRTVTVGAQDGTLFAAPGTELPRDQLTTGVSVSMRPTKALAVSLGYDALIATSSASAQAATVRVDYQF